MPYSSDNKPTKEDQIDCIFPNLESALNTLHIYSFGLESTKVPDFNVSARTGLASLIRQVCISGFEKTDSDSEKENELQDKIVALVEGGIQKKN